MCMRMNARRPRASPETFEEVVNLVGGRLTYMGKVTKAADMVRHAKHLLDVEKAWLLSQIGLIPDCDDDVMDEQKWSSCSWLLLREFVKRRQDDVARKREEIERGEAKPEDLDDLPLPRISYVRCYGTLRDLVLIFSTVQYEARQIMTRADFMDGTHTSVPPSSCISIPSMSRRTRPEEHHRYRRESLNPLRLISRYR